MLTIRNQIPTLQNPTLGSAFDIGISGYLDMKWIYIQTISRYFLDIWI